MATKKRHVPEVEALEARETPDVSLGSSAGLTLPLPALALTNPPSLGEWSSPSVSPRLPAMAAGAFSLPALDALFGDQDDLRNLLGTADPAPGGDEPRGARTEELQGLRFLSNYTRKAIRNEQSRLGSGADADDLVQQVFVEWWEQAGPRPQALSALLNRASPEHGVLRKTVRRVLDHARYERAREGRMMELRDQPAPIKPAEQEWIDLRLDWEAGATGAARRERQLVELRRQGMTFEEIGTELGVPKQRVCEMVNAAVERLQERYGE